MSLLTLIQKSADLLGIPRPLGVVSSTDQQVRQLLAIANEEGEALATRHDWQALRVQQTFVTTATPEQATALPTDIDHFVPSTFYNRTTRRGVVGPITPQEWQAIQAQPQLNRVILAFVERSGQFLITPTPPAGQTIAYEYVSKNWCIGQGSVPKAEYTADTDTTYLDEALMKLGIRWRFRKTKGLDYAEDFRTYEQSALLAMARDGGSAPISIGGSSSGRLANIPEGDFPGP